VIDRERARDKEESRVHARRLAINFPKLPHTTVVNEGLLITTVKSILPGLYYHRFHTLACDRYTHRPGFANDLGVRGLNRAVPFRQGIRGSLSAYKSSLAKCGNCDRSLKVAGTVIRWLIYLEKVGST
jgi:hypothetical protein